MFFTNNCLLSQMSQNKNWVVVGISGVTCGGKTTFATALRDLFPDASIVHQDKYFLQPDDARHTRIRSLNHLNWEIPSALDMDKMRSDIKRILSRLVWSSFYVFTFIITAISNQLHWRSSWYYKCFHCGNYTT